MHFEKDWSRRASRDLIRIIDYLNSRDPDWADAVLTAISERLDFISQFPYLSFVFDVTPVGEIREVLAANYRIFFMVNEHDQVVRIKGIQHAHQQDPEFPE
jgi:plasmid stabilization system protein ParE